MGLHAKTRNVSLTPENDVFIEERVASGRFANASEVVRVALRLLVDDKRRRDIVLNQDTKPKHGRSSANLAGV